MSYGNDIKVIVRLDLMNFQIALFTIKVVYLIEFSHISNNSNERI